VSESPNQMVISDPSDHPIEDSFGNAWRITESGQVSADGVLDEDSSDVMQLAYVNQTMWLQTKDLMWRSKRHPGDEWWPPDGTRTSPLNGPVNKEIGEIERAIQQVLVNLAVLKADFDTYKTQPPASIAPVLSAVAVLQADLDARGDDQPALVRLLDQILAGQAAAASAANANQAIVVGLLDQITAAQASNYASVIARLNDLLAAVQQQSAPTSIGLDLAHGTHVPQSVPSRGGP
jgi:hypothetical protein